MGIRLVAPLPGFPATQGPALLTVGTRTHGRNHDGGAGTGSHEVGTMVAIRTGTL